MTTALDKKMFLTFYKTVIAKYLIYLSNLELNLS